jgi:hypothetical protein
VLAAIVLGGRDEVFSDAAALLAHGFAAYELSTLVRQGEPLGSVTIPGGTVPVIAGEDLVALLRPGDDGHLDRALTARPGVAYPPPVGSSIGAVVVTGPSGVLGRARIAVGDLAPPEPPSGPWWLRAGSALVRGLAAAIDGLAG